MAKKTTKRGLGRGLSALMSDVAEEQQTSGTQAAAADQMLPIEKVHPNPDQPRRSFDQHKLDELSASIAEKGIIQPLIVRTAGANTYEIVAGERRWRAAQMAKLHQVPVIVREFSDTEVLEIAIIENIQRADLNPVEEAAGFSQLMGKFGHTQEKLSKALSKSRSYIANSVRLLALPEEVQGYLRDGKLSAGHARALITSDDPAALAREVIRKNLSVRETEKLAKAGLGNNASQKGRVKTKLKTDKDADTKALEGDLSAGLGMKVQIDHKPGKENGAMTIRYDSFEQLDDLCRLLNAMR